jgi:hypothetical protein
LFLLQDRVEEEEARWGGGEIGEEGSKGEVSKEKFCIATFLNCHRHTPSVVAERE